MHGTFQLTDMEGFIHRQNSMSYNVTQFCVYIYIYIKVNQSHYRPEVPRVFEEVKVPRFRDNGPGWW